jgi:hypothetical protein
VGAAKVVTSEAATTALALTGAEAAVLAGVAVCAASVQALKVKLATTAKDKNKFFMRFPFSKKFKVNIKNNNTTH